MERSARSVSGGTTSVSVGGVSLSVSSGSSVSDVTVAMLDMVVPDWTPSFTVTVSVIISKVLL